MNLLNYSLAAIISYIGLFIGFFLAIIAKEEIKPGKKYFMILQKIILLLAFIFLLIYLNLNYILVLLILVFIVVYISKTENKIPLIYIILSIIFYLSSKNSNLLIIESSLIFLYGIPTGSLLTRKSKKETIINILKNIPFILIAIILFLIF